MLYLFHSILYKQYLYLNVCFFLDLDEEIILLDLCEKIEAKELASKVPENSAKYHLFRFQYEFGNESKQALGNC